MGRKEKLKAMKRAGNLEETDSGRKSSGEKSFEPKLKSGPTMVKQTRGTSDAASSSSNTKSKPSAELKSTLQKKKPKLPGESADTEENTIDVQKRMETLHIQPPMTQHARAKKKTIRSSCFYIRAYGQAKHLTNIVRIFARLPLLTKGLENSKEAFSTLIETPRELSEVLSSVIDLGPQFALLAKSGGVSLTNLENLYTTIPQQPGSVFMCAHGLGRKITNFFRLLCHLPSDEVHPSPDILQVEGEKLKELLDSAWIVNVYLMNK